MRVDILDPAVKRAPSPHRTNPHGHGSWPGLWAPPSARREPGRAAGLTQAGFAAHAHKRRVDDRIRSFHCVSRKGACRSGRFASTPCVTGTRSTGGAAFSSVMCVRRKRQGPAPTQGRQSAGSLLHVVQTTDAELGLPRRSSARHAAFRRLQGVSRRCFFTGCRRTTRQVGASSVICTT